MIWHTDLVVTDALERLLNAIRCRAGTIVSCKHAGDCIQVTWTAAA